MLPEIVEAVGDKLTVLFDSGIRTGVDVIKALSLGAKAVLVGRPVIYGLGIAGKVHLFYWQIVGSTDFQLARSQGGLARPFGRSRSIHGSCWHPVNC